jgi:hypothetical protein
METPTTIKEEGTRWTVENARPRGMRILIGLVAPIAIGFIALSMINDVREHKWWMLVARFGFAVVVAVSAVFSLFGAESVSVEGGEVVWRRGSSQERRCGVADVAKLERVGNHLRVHVKGEKHPMVVGAGLRQQPAAIAWLAKRLEAAIIAARKGT